jgi:transmembrane sensor
MSPMDERRCAEEAAEWLFRLEDDPTAACKAEFASWAARSPLHMEQFLLVTAASRELDGLDPEQRIDVEALLRAMPAQEAACAVPLRAEAWLPKPAQAADPIRAAEAGVPGAVVAAARRHWQVAAALAASLLVLAVAIPRWMPGTPTQRFATALGEQRSIKLGDDSVVQMNTQSQVEVRLSSESRDVRLIEGEALFAVAHDPKRPFRVISNGAVIQAIGTQFNVYRHGAQTTVAVVEGVVSISTSTDAGTRLEAGEVASIGERGRIARRGGHAAAEQVVWRQRKLDFRGASLQDVVEQFNRYNRVQLRIEDAQIARREVNGVFNADEPHALLEFLAQDPQVRLEQRAGETVIGAR